MPRFALLAHDHPDPHLDLLLESGGVLRSWRLPAEPAAAGTLPAEPLPDHRTLYLDYEGPVSGGRGTVTRLDGGGLEWLDDRPGLARARLAGSRLRGVATLTPAGDVWMLDWRPDA